MCSAARRQPKPDVAGETDTRQMGRGCALPTVRDQPMGERKPTRSRAPGQTGVGPNAALRRA